MPWVCDPDYGGTKIEDTVKQRLRERVISYAETNFAGCYTRIEIRFRMQFCYVDAYTEPPSPDPGWTSPIGETIEEYKERLRNIPYHLFRLRFFGDEEKWGLAFYSYAHLRYELSVFASGKFFGTPEEALQTAGEFYLLH